MIPLCDVEKRPLAIREKSGTTIRSTKQLIIEHGLFKCTDTQLSGTKNVKLNVWGQIEV